ncbi:hypothetical protein CICLE_v10018391mg [Citrus x clementina]|uniref:Uncharacterized protein n=1 Tax=Citrus clementina TaxID=85681 RepID=V4TZ73_CITCL|nr:hypothetical protein CICLE_v10018391mg [Citrus x clementina]
MVNALYCLIIRTTTFFSDKKIYLYSKNRLHLLSHHNLGCHSLTCNLKHFGLLIFHCTPFEGNKLHFLLFQLGLNKIIARPTQVLRKLRKS